MARARRTAHQKWLEKVAREASRQRIAHARAELRAARVAKRTAVRRAREVCQQARITTRAWITSARDALRARIAQLREDLAKQIAGKRADVRACCGPDRQKVRARADARIAQLRGQLEELQRDRDVERIWASSKVAPLEARRSRAREARQMPDHELELELEPDELIVWRRVKRQIPKATAHASRLDQFRRWVHDHAGDVQRILIEDAERQVQAAIRAEARERAALSQLRKRSPTQHAQTIRDHLEAVPF